MLRTAAVGQAPFANTVSCLPLAPCTSFLSLCCLRIQLANIPSWVFFPEDLSKVGCCYGIPTAPLAFPSAYRDGRPHTLTVMRAAPHNEVFLSVPGIPPTCRGTCCCLKCRVTNAAHQFTGACHGSEYYSIIAREGSKMIDDTEKQATEKTSWAT